MKRLTASIKGGVGKKNAPIAIEMMTRRSRNFSYSSYG
ncbi:hypothetical protein ABIB80_004052 [Bradyrhizobium sp. i1.15.2]